MKKRIKMVLTSAMLAFSLSMLSFGVLAATQHILGINNFIIFDIVDNIACDIEAVSGISTSPDVNFNAAYSASGNKTIKLTGDMFCTLLAKE